MVELLITESFLENVVSILGGFRGFLFWAMVLNFWSADE